MDVIGGFEGFGVGEEGLADDFGTLELLVKGGVVVLEGVLAQAFLDEEVLVGIAEELELGGVDVA